MSSVPPLSQSVFGAAGSNGDEASLFPANMNPTPASAAAPGGSGLTSNNEGELADFLFPPPPTVPSSLPPNHLSASSPMPMTEEPIPQSNILHHPTNTMAAAGAAATAAASGGSRPPAKRTLKRDSGGRFAPSNGRRAGRGSKAKPRSNKSHSNVSSKQGRDSNGRFLKAGAEGDNEAESASAAERSGQHQHLTVQVPPSPQLPANEQPQNHPMADEPPEQTQQLQRQPFLQDDHHNYHHPLAHVVTTPSRDERRSESSGILYTLDDNGGYSSPLTAGLLAGLYGNMEVVDGIDDLERMRSRYSVDQKPPHHFDEPLFPPWRRANPCS